MNFKLELLAGSSREIAADAAMKVIPRFLEAAEIPDELTEYRKALRVLLIDGAGLSA